MLGKELLLMGGAKKVGTLAVTNSSQYAVEVVTSNYYSTYVEYGKPKEFKNDDVLYISSGAFVKDYKNIRLDREHYEHRIIDRYQDAYIHFGYHEGGTN